jgi:hypothetical protein
MAWLSAVPDEDRPKGKADKSRPISRGEVFKVADYEPPFPDVGEYGILINYLGEVGVCRQSAGGPIPLVHKDVTGWLELAEIELSSMFSLMLIRLSRQYVSTLAKSTNPLKASPYTPEGDEELWKTYKKLKSALNNG